MAGEFTPEQKRYLEGFTSGLLIARSRVQRHAAEAAEDRLTLSVAEASTAGPDAPALEAQNRVLRSGRKLSDQEKFKRDQHPFDAYDRLKDQAACNEAPALRRPLLPLRHVMSPAIVLARSSVSHPLPVALRPDGAPVCFSSATSFAPEQPSLSSEVPLARFSLPLRPLYGFRDLDRHRSGLRAVARPAPTAARFPHSG